MAKWADTIKKVFLTNRPSESILLIINFFSPNLTYKLIPSNIMYKNGTIRKIKRKGIRYELDISDYPGWSLYFNQKADSSANVLNYLNKDMKFIIDIGANIGQTSLMIWNKLPHSRIISFEPYPQTFTKLIHNVRLNKANENITPLNLALGKETGELTMYQDCVTNSAGNRILIGDEKTKNGMCKVVVETLDNVVVTLQPDKIDFIKIDVEGFEFNVISGASSTLKKYRPKLFIEVNDHNLKAQGSGARQLIETLVAIGYRIVIADTNEKINLEKLGNAHIDIVCMISGN